MAEAVSSTFSTTPVPSTLKYTPSPEGVGLLFFNICIAGAYWQTDYKWPAVAQLGFGAAVTLLEGIEPRERELTKALFFLTILSLGVYCCLFIMRMNRQDIDIDEEAHNNLEEFINTHPPARIKELLDKHISGQDKAKQDIATAAYNHYCRLLAIENGDETLPPRSSLIYIGPTGSGKTLVIQTLAKILNVPFVIVNTASLTPSGFHGDDVEDCFLDLLKQAHYNTKKAQRGIIVFDEIDKMRKNTKSNSKSSWISGVRMQQTLLQYIGGITASIEQNLTRLRTRRYTLDTNCMFFIAGGAFVGLDKIVRRRLESNPETNRRVLPEDLIKYGFIPEFVGRFSQITEFEHLTPETLVTILTEPKNSFVKQFQALFRTHGTELTFTPRALARIAEHAYAKGTGARALEGTLKTVLDEHMYRNPTEPAKKIVITQNYVLERLSQL